jgi:hypothetical protein
MPSSEWTPFQFQSCLLVKQLRKLSLYSYLLLTELENLWHQIVIDEFHNKVQIAYL